MINLLPRKKFEITLEDGTIIRGQSGTWCLKRFCDRSKCTLDEFEERFKAPSIDDVCNLLLCAVEQSAREQGLPFSFTDVHACIWIDELGGLSSDLLMQVFKHMGSDIEGDATGEKKSNLAGENLLATAV